MTVLSTDAAKKGFGERLKAAFIEAGKLGPERGLPQRVARRYKAFTYQAVQKWFIGKSLPEAVHLTMICTDLGISIDWLFSGEGQMRISDRERGYWPFDFDQRRFDNLTKGQKTAVNGILKGLIIDYEDERPMRSAQGRR